MALYIVGTGPGEVECLTLEAYQILKKVDLIVGYHVYIELIAAHFSSKEFYRFNMGDEIERVRFAISRMKEGKEVAIVSGGDPSLYGLASLAYELMDDTEEILVLPGVTSALAASARLGAPISNDLIVVSLSDHLVPYELIKKRLMAANFGDLVVAIYNPRSRKRADHLKDAFEILGERGDLPIGVVKNCYRDNEEIWITKISEIDYEQIDMQTVLIVGNSKTYIKNGKMITPRGYLEKYGK
jgi:precorrin-3B C17-methyltransferase